MGEGGGGAAAAGSSCLRRPLPEGPRCGSWLAQQGDRGLRVPGDRLSHKTAPPRNVPLGERHRRAEPFGGARAYPPGGGLLFDADALDELLSHIAQHVVPPGKSVPAADSGRPRAAPKPPWPPPLPPRRLDSSSYSGGRGMGGRCVPSAASNSGAGGGDAAMSSQSKPRPPRRRLSARVRNSFWQPRCGGTERSNCGPGSDSESDDASSTLSSSDGSADTAERDFLRFVAEAATQGMVPPVGRPSFFAAAPAAASAPARRHRGGAASVRGPASSSSRRRPGQLDGSETGAGPSPPPREGSADPRCAGVDGGASRGTASPQADIASELVAARAQGPDAARRALKRLLLRWHPDKAPQGDGLAAASARAEATRVLRFILDERERLGL